MNGAPAGAAAPRDDVLLRIRDLSVEYRIKAGLFSQGGTLRAVDGVSFDIKRGETLGLVGESGCGKTTVGRAILRLTRPTGGSVMFEGRDIAALQDSEMRDARRSLQMVFQDPFASLNPRISVGGTIGEPIAVHGIRSGAQAVRERVEDLLDIVGLTSRFYDRYPHELSGGQRQRVGIARALAVEPAFLVCDEAVSALDVSVQAQIINLFEKLQDELGLTYLFIAHGLAVVRHISKRVAVMYLGKIVELAPADRLYAEPLHPYTRSLMSAVPVPDPVIEKNRRRIILKGDVPSPMNPPPGCRFHTRCPIAIEKCRHDVPPLTEQRGGHWAACWRADESAALMPLAVTPRAAPRPTPPLAPVLV